MSSQEVGRIGGSRCVAGAGSEGPFALSFFAAHNNSAATTSACAALTRQTPLGWDGAPRSLACCPTPPSLQPNAPLCGSLSPSVLPAATKAPAFVPARMLHIPATSCPSLPMITASPAPIVPHSLLPSSTTARQALSARRRRRTRLQPSSLRPAPTCRRPAPMPR